MIAAPIAGYLLDHFQRYGHNLGYSVVFLLAVVYYSMGTYFGTLSPRFDVSLVCRSKLCPLISSFVCSLRAPLCAVRELEGVA